MKNSLWKRITAVFVAVVIIITSMPIQSVSVSAVPAATTGIGVVNDAHVGEGAHYNNYVIKFYKAGTRFPAVEFSINDSNSEVVYVAADGSFELTAGRAIDFTADSEFRKFINDNRIDQVDISFISSVNMNPDTYTLYNVTNSGTNAAAGSDGVSYTIVNTTPKLDEHGNIVYKTDPVTGDPTTEPEMVDKNIAAADYMQTVFASSANKDYDVNVNWHDKGGNRPSVTFDVAQNNDFTYNEGTPVITQPTSNNTVYTYSVPEYDLSGNAYSYSAKTGNYAGYRVVQTGSDFDLFSLKSFDCTLSWLQGNSSFEPNDIEAIRSYVIANYKLKDETVVDSSGNLITREITFGDATTYDESGQLLTLDRNMITYNFADGKLSISGLDEITKDGRAKTYYLDVVNTTADVGNGGDIWTLTAENTGINSSVTNRVYHGGKVENLLTGTTRYNADIQWKDKERETTRSENTNPGELTLWRYVLDPSDPEHEKKAQVGTYALIETDANGNPVLENGKPKYLSTFSAPSLDKYDTNGYPYVYYAKESLNLPDYDIKYTNTTNETSQAMTGGTITNKLSKTEIYTVDAKWIAAARQGGSAEAKYVLQKKVGDSWVNTKVQKTDSSGNPVFDTNGNPVMVDNILEIRDFSAETMEKKDSFEPVDIFDENGKLIEYRVQQIYVERTDKGNNGTNSDPYSDGTSQQKIELKDTNNTVTDEYELTVIKNGSNYTFEYRLVGTVYLDVVKRWNCGGTDVSASFSNINVPVSITQYKFGKGYDTYVSPRTEDPNNPGQYIVDTNFTDIPDGAASVTSTDGWHKTITVPHYDESGHEYLYRVNEGTVTGVDPAAMGPEYANYKYYSEYNYEYINDTYKYTITNQFTVDPGYEWVRIKKEWQDDGETEYRTRLNVEPAPAVYTNPNPDQNHPSPDYATSVSKAYMDEGSMWEGYVTAYSGFTASVLNNHPDYNKELFKEYAANAIQDTYTYTDGNGQPQTITSAYITLEQFRLINNFATDEEAVRKWIYMVRSAKTGDQGTIDLSDETIGLAGSTGSFNFSDVSGFFRNNGHYYIVQQKWDGGYLTFTNTRIGVVNYEIDFKWKIGAQTKPDVKVRIVGKVGNTQVFTRDQTVSYNDVVNNKYCLLNLPKYDNQGRIIEYTLEEIEIDNQQVHTVNSVTSVDLNNGNDKCVVEVKNNEYQKGTISNSDDIMGITITSRFSDSVNFTVHKQWYDNNNEQNLRSDIYIRLYQNNTKLLNEYRLTRSNTDHLNYWTYTFESLDKYDADGNLYTYRVEEIPLQKYKTSYYSTYVNVNDPSNVSSGSYVTDGGTITNTLYDEVTVHGKKLWNNISSDLDKKHYPIAQIYLWRSINGKTKEDLDKDSSLNGSVINVGSTDIFSGEAEYKFVSTDINPSGSYITQGGIPKMKDGSVLLPKYDDYGRAYTYSLSEKSINGYTFKISNDQVVNEYNGGRPMEIEVTKKWTNMDKNSIFPTIKVILHQVFFAKTYGANGTVLQNDGTFAANGNDPKISAVEYATYEKILRNEEVSSAELNSGLWKYTFGKLDSNGKRINPKEDIRQLAPDGGCFAYYITEEITNYKGQTVVINANENGNSADFLGSFYRASEVQSAIQNQGTNMYTKYHDVPVNYQGLGFKVKTLTQPETVENELYTEQNKDVVIQRYALVNNSYEPGANNFQGRININKSWNNHNGQNSRNNEFDDFTNYTVTVGRKTPKIGHKNLFRIETGNSSSDVPTITWVGGTEEFEIDLNTHAMTPYRADGTKILTGSSDTVSYYEQKVKYKNKSYSDIDQLLVTIRINKNPGSADHNKIEIDGLAIYAQDGVRYTYSVAEEPIAAYKATETQHSEMDANNNDTAEFSFNNELDVFTLNLYKVFGKKYTPQGGSNEITDVLDPDDYDQYFDDAFVNTLSFTLYRKEGQNGTYEPYKYGAADINDNPTYKVARSTNSSGKTIYSKAFYNLPKYSKNGELFYYKVVESDKPQGARYSVTYTTVISDSGNSNSDYSGISCGKTEDSKSTYVRNSFESKQITLNKYWDDNNNCDGMRPAELQVTLKEHINNTITDVYFNRTLEGSNQWTKKIELPKYYYNGADPIDHLTFGIDETLTAEDRANGYTFKEKGYETRTGNTVTKASFTSGDLVSIEDGDFYALYVENQKTRVNSKLNFNKTWTDYDNKWAVRPDNIYIKVVRTPSATVTPDSSGYYNIPGSSASGGTLDMRITGLPVKNQSGSNYTYRIRRRTVVNETEQFTDVSYSAEPVYEENNTEYKTISFGVSGVAVQDTVQLVVERSANGTDYEAVTSYDANNPVGIQIAGASAKQETVILDNTGSSNISATVNGSSYTADSKGVITLPVTGSGDISAVIENLDFGKNTGGTNQADGVWEQYYYTVVECDKDGNSINTTFGGEEVSDSSSRTPISTKLTFTLDISSYKTGGTDQSINIKVIRSNDGQIDANGHLVNGELVKKDMTGLPVSVKIKGEKYFASGHLEGVIVIPVNYDENKIECVIDGLAYSDGTAPYSYEVRRCKADNNSSDHNTPLVFDGTASSTLSGEPETTGFSFEKKFGSDDYNNDLRSEKIYFKLFRYVDGEAPEEVTTYADGNPLTLNSGTFDTAKHMFECNVNANTVSGLITNLPNGRTDVDSTLNSTSDAVWKKYHYYVQECDENGIAYAQNRPHDDPYEWSQTMGERKPFKLTLVSNTRSEAELTEGIDNELRKTNHYLNKIWADENDQYESRAPYAVSLMRKEGTTGTWEAVSFDQASAENSNVFYVSDTGQKTAIVLSADQTEFINSENNLKMLFDNLPQYSKNGLKYEYCVVENKIKRSNDPNETNYNLVQENKLYMFTIDNTFVTVVRRGTSNYYVDYEYDAASSQITNKIVTKAVGYIHIEAKKVWQDEKNLYGKRPDKITFTLTRKVVTTNNGVVTKTPDGYRNAKDAKEANKWITEWKNCAAFDSAGHEYEYTVTEEDLTGTGYSQIQGSPSETYEIIPNTDEITKKYTFTNKYEPDKKKLTAEKTWNDQSNAFLLRPAKVRFTLCCDYDVYEDDGTDENGKPKYKKSNNPYTGPASASILSTRSDYLGSSYEYTKTIDVSDAVVEGGNTNTDKWKTEFADLPAWINPTADPVNDTQKNGVSVEVKYYVTEELLDSSGNVLALTQQKDYVCPVNSSKVSLTEAVANTDPVEYQAADNKTEIENKLNTHDIIVKKIWNDSNTDPAQYDLHYDIDVTLSNNTLNYNSSSATYSQTRAIPKDSTNGVIFRNLPKYSGGTEIAYDVSEAVAAVSSGTLVNKVDADLAAPLSHDALTARSGNSYGFNVLSRKYGYEGNCESYKLSADNAEDITRQYEITNTLPVSRFTAQKVWDDDNNRDGVRPRNVKFTLSNNEGITETGTAAGSGWSTDFGGASFPTCGSDNTSYTYTIMETTPTGYSSSKSEGTPSISSNITTRTDTFTNSYTPVKKNVTLEKKWVDTVGTTINGTTTQVDYSSWTRPAAIKVRLKIKIGSGEFKCYSQLNATEKERLGLPPAYQDEIEIDSTTNSDSGKTWSKIINNLPKKINLTGSPTDPGNSEDVTYFIEEVNSYGYTDTYSSAITLGDDNKLTVTNTLKTTSIKIYKEWDDKKLDNSGDYTGTDYSHFTITGKITSSDNTYLNDKTFTITSTGRGSSSNPPADYTEITGVPIYKKDGTNAKYTIEELNVVGGSPNMQYGYEAITGKFTDIILNENQANSVTFSNKLPLTTVNVTKTWTDDNNTNSLRPDSITLSLFRTTVSNLARNGSVTGDASTGWEQVGTDETVNGTSNSAAWSHTFTDLLKNDQNNNPYYFKVEETAVKAYSTTYTQSAPTKPDSTTNRAALGITNTLITRDVEIEKQWDDSGYPNAASLHYNIDFTLTREADTGANIYVPQKLEYTGTLTADTTKPNDAVETITIHNVPVYDKNGDVISYTASEKGKAYGYELVSNYPQQVSTTPAGVSDSCVTKYIFKNKLPVTYLRVRKDWKTDTEFHSYPKSSISYNLTRSVSVNGTETPDNSFNNDSINVSRQIALSAAMEDIIYYDSQTSTYTPLLVYNQNNRQYKYSVTEDNIAGFTTTYKVGNVEQNYVYAVNNNNSSPQTIDIINTQIIGEVKVVKIDGSYYDAYHNNPNYSDIRIDDAHFRLYIKDNGNEVKVPVALQSDGTYKYSYDDRANADCNCVVSATVSGEKGVIRITGLPLNTYYLREDDGYDAPSGFVKDTVTEYSFTVSSESATTYDSNFKGSGIHGIGNEEIPRTINLTKVDAEDNSKKLEGATYYLLRLIPFEVKVTSEGSPGDYLEAAKDAVIHSGGSYSSAVADYWVNVGTRTTKTDGTINAFVNQMFGTYTFLEVQAPVGYELDNSLSSGLEPKETSQQLQNAAFVHQDPRKKAKVDILKLDEFDNPLNGAEFELWYRPVRYNPVTNYTYEYTDPPKINPPDYTESHLITPRTDNDYTLSNMIVQLSDAPVSGNVYTLNRLHPEFAVQSHVTYVPVSDNQPVPSGGNTYQDGDICVATLKTGDDGLTREVTFFDSSYVEVVNNKIVVKNWGTYYFKETKAPTGYTADNTFLDIFAIGAEQADKTVNVINAGNTRKTGTVTLNKTAKQSTGEFGTGSAVPNAVFNLHSIDENGTETPCYVTDNGTGNYSLAASGTADLTTDSNGQIHIDTLAWGRYVLVEKTAPAGFSANDSDTNAPNRVYFTVGRNNCATDQQLTCTDEALYANISIKKNIDARTDAWGDPTFIFKLRQTHKLYTDGTTQQVPAAKIREQLISMTFTGSGLTRTSDTISIEPGIYEVSEIGVARYDLTNVSWTVNGSAAGTNDKKATVTVHANDTAEVTFDNKLSYYDKFTQVSAEKNKFAGDKGIKVEYNTLVSSANTSAEINKTALTAFIINSDGEKRAMPDKTQLTISYTARTGDDTRFTVTDNGSKFTVNNANLFADQTYVLTARYKGFETTFSITFDANSNTTKTERTVVFKADADNYSYFVEGGTRISQYSFTFVIDNTTNAVTEVRHNGTKLDDPESTYNSMVFNINEAYIASKELAGWNDGSTVQAANMTYSALAGAVLSSSADTITYTAQIGDITTP